MTEDGVARLIALGEGHTTEFKRSMPSNLGAEICAFANATGGVILLGVTDEGKAVGVGGHNRLKSQAQTIARSAEPPIAVEVESVGGVLVVNVPEQHGKPYSFGGRFHIREGANCQQMSREEIRESFYKEGLIRFDETPCASFDLRRDLTPETWTRFAARARIPADMEPLTALENLHLLREGRMTHAGAWLLADDVTRFSLQAGVTCALLSGVTKTHILDLKNFTGDLYTIYENCVSYAQAKLNTALIPHLYGRHERLELPEGAIREALVNAIAHRDYRSSANVQMYLFSDRLEIVTPGGLPAGMREEDLGVRSVPRNRLLFGMFHRMGMVEQIGSGIRRIRQECLEYGVSEPLIEVSDNWVTTTFSRPAAAPAGGAGTGMTKPPPQRTEVREGTKSAPSRRQVEILRNCRTSKSILEIMANAGRRDRTKFRRQVMQPLLDAGWLAMTIPDKPTSSRQKYRLTAAGRQLLDDLQAAD